MNKWTIRFLLGLAIGVFLIKGGFVFIGPILRYALIFFLIYLGYRTYKVYSAISGKINSEFNYRNPKNGGSYGSNGRQNYHDGTTIEICPECGSEKKPGHKCKK